VNKPLRAYPSFALGILGLSGRMGSAVAEAALSSSFIQEIRGTYHTNTPLTLSKEIHLYPASKVRAVFEKSQVILDFSHPCQALNHLNYAITTHKPFLLGTTGLSETTTHALKSASKKIPLLIAPNTSLSTALLEKMLTELSAALGPHTHIKISDHHHKHKKDTPSGTALSWEQALKKPYIHTDPPLPTVSMASTREGEACGTHHVTFETDAECIKLEHQLLNRDSLAQGALHAAGWLSTQPCGLYRMQDVLKDQMAN